MPIIKNILAIYPEHLEQRIFDPMPPLGLAWIAAIVREQGYNIRVIDEQVETLNVGTLANDISPSIVLIGGTSHSRFDAFARATEIKATHPPATIIYGGPHASFTAEDTLLNVPAIDIIAHGEGEYTVLDLIKWKEAGEDINGLEKIEGISYRMNNGVASTVGRRFNKELDKLPFPARDLLPIERYNMSLEYLGLPALHVITARGCPFDCSFCSASQMYNHSYAARSPKLVVDEIEALVRRYNIKGIKIFDSTFTINKNHVLSFCNELKWRGLVMPWECEIRVGSVDKPLLEQMQKAGCYYVDIGVESADQDVLDTMNKQIYLDEAEKLLGWCKQLGLRTKVFFTVGHIKETYRAGLKTIRFIRKKRKYMTLIGYNPGIRIYPGTQVEAYARHNNILPDGFRWSKPYENRDNLRIYLAVNNIPLLLQPQMGIRELKKLRHRYILSRITSPYFLLSKLMTLLRHKEIKKYFGLGLRGLFMKK
jgi:magnesium-protoporphyrin IX monomethyl ester (oxidative) cyclase